MGTVNRAFADRIKAGNGWLDGNSDNSLGDNPRCRLIVHYTNAWGGDAYGLVFADQPDKYQPSPYVRNPHVYWEAAE